MGRLVRHAMLCLPQVVLLVLTTHYALCSFMRSIPRIAARGYIPDVDDILHARIQTYGVSEHTFDTKVNGKLVTWHLYDVGGARGMRHTWIPFFDDANAIIFVAPISAFDQVNIGLI